MNAGAVLIANMTSASPIVVTTAANHNFITGMVVTIKVPKENGLQNPAAATYQQRDFFVSGIITLTGATTFIIPGNTFGTTAFGATLPTYAVPATYSCSEHVNPTFKPTYRLISNVTNSYPATVTTAIDHGWLTGLVVRLLMPAGIGMFQADKLFGTITVTGNTTFTIPIDTTNFSSFVIYPINRSANQHVNICALALPIGEDNSQLYQAVNNVLT